jgi:hypothetical protein
VSENDIGRLFKMSVQISLASLAGTLATVNALHRAGLIDKMAMTEIAAAINANLREAEALAGGNWPGMAEARASLDTWSAP